MLLPVLQLSLTRQPQLAIMLLLLFLTQHVLLCLVKSLCWMIVEAAAVLEMSAKHKQEVLGGNLGEQQQARAVPDQSRIVARLGHLVQHQAHTGLHWLHCTW